MDWSKGCHETEDYVVVDETAEYYVCRCNKCGEYFRKYKN